MYPQLSSQALSPIGLANLFAKRILIFFLNLQATNFQTSFRNPLKLNPK
jgi:hypothetical protein